MVDFSKVGAAAAESEDMTKAVSMVREIPRAGSALLRLRDYIELGRHKPKNPTHKPALKAILVFELSHPDHLVEFDGKKEPQSFTVRVNKAGTSDSNFRRLFATMNAAHDNKYNHFVQMLGLPFLGEIFHNVQDAGTDKEKTYANLDSNKAWSLKAPVQVNVMDSTQNVPIPVMELSQPSKCFLWENENVSDEDVVGMWESLYIEGEREVEDKKTKEKKMVSKNWIQELVMTNIDWADSRTCALTQEHLSLDGDEGLGGVVGTEPTPEQPVADNALAAAASSAPEANELPSI